MSTDSSFGFLRAWLYMFIIFIYMRGCKFFLRYNILKITSFDERAAKSKYDAG